MIRFLLWAIGVMIVCGAMAQARNPVIFADVPDQSIIRVKGMYYMSSTTMHMSPGLPIMASKDLVNWRLIRYAYDTLATNDQLNLEHGASAYGKGSWASSLRFHRGIYYVSTFDQTTNRTYIFSTKDLVKGSWKRISFQPAYHDHSLFFDDDGKKYLVYGAGTIRIVELKEDLSGVRGETERVLIENASAPAGPDTGLPAEGSQLFKINKRYYLFNITWPKGGMRTVLVHRAGHIGGPWEGRLAFQDRGIAQGGLIDTPGGEWYAYLFRDYGSVGRIPYLVPVRWVAGWPQIGKNGKTPSRLKLPASRGLIPGIASSDEFDDNERTGSLSLVWQWNHNPVDSLWSVRRRKGFLRLQTARVDTSLVMARNILTQRALGPKSSGSVSIDLSGMKDGDIAGLCALQKNYGFIGVKREGTRNFLFVGSFRNTLSERVELTQSTIHLRVSFDFTDRKDSAAFLYSLDGDHWTTLGSTLQLAYTLPHFMGYRFGLFNFSTREPGGYVDFDYFHLAQ